MEGTTLAILFASVGAIYHRHHHKHRAHAQAKYEPEWGHNSGNSYNNGPFTHFYHGKASPYSVIKEDVQLGAESEYEPEWGHNSGNSYDNSPFSHFYHGKASPYSVIKEDV